MKNFCLKFSQVLEMNRGFQWVGYQSIQKFKILVYSVAFHFSKTHPFKGSVSVVFCDYLWTPTVFLEFSFTKKNACNCRTLWLKAVFSSKNINIYFPQVSEYKFVKTFKFFKTTLTIEYSGFSKNKGYGIRGEFTQYVSEHCRFTTFTTF